MFAQGEGGSWLLPATRTTRAPVESPSGLIHADMNPMLLHNISNSLYFIKCFEKLKDWGALVEESGDQINETNF